MVDDDAIPRRAVAWRVNAKGSHRFFVRIVFFETETIEDIEQDYIGTGKYQHSAHIEELKQSWRPQMMLPRMYDDREARRAARKAARAEKAEREAEEARAAVRTNLFRH